MFDEWDEFWRFWRCDHHAVDGTPLEEFKWRYETLTAVWFRETVKIETRCADAISSYLFKEINNMARKKAAAPAPKTVSKGFRFINVTLPEAEAENLDVEYATPEVVYDHWLLLMQQNYKVGFTYDGKTDAVICTLQCRDEFSPNFEAVMSSFADDWYNALRVSLFKHYVLLKEKWDGSTEKPQRARFG